LRLGCGPKGEGGGQRARQRQYEFHWFPPK
jgi:hypothetical protein